MTSSTEADVLARISAAVSEATPDVHNAASLADLDAAKRAVVGKSGTLMLLRRAIGGLDADARRTVGEALNQPQHQIADLLPSREQELLDPPPPFNLPLPLPPPAFPPSAARPP